MALSVRSACSTDYDSVFCYHCQQLPRSENSSWMAFLAVGSECTAILVVKLAVCLGVSRPRVAIEGGAAAFVSTSGGSRAPLQVLVEPRLLKGRSGRPRAAWISFGGCGLSASPALRRLRAYAAEA
jgi:hypothetical protein